MSDAERQNPHEMHGRLLMGQGRFAEAEAKFREALQGNPLDAGLLHMLALCQYLQDDGESRAVITIRDAIARQPETAAHHALHAQILTDLQRMEEARQAAERAVQLDPTDPGSHNAMTYFLLRAEQWAGAEASARHALALDADDTTAANHLATALRLQNKMAENADQIRGMLARDPEDPRTHATAGWSALQAGQRDDAQRHFLESLRLQPGYPAARDGLLEAFKSRSPAYRAYLAWCFFMQRLDRNQRWMIIIGLYLLNRFARVLFTGSMAPLGITITVLYLAFALWTFLARGVGGLLLLRDRFARHVLDRGEKLEAMLVGGGVALGLPCLALGVLVHAMPLVIFGGTFVVTAVPASMVFRGVNWLGGLVFGVVAAYCLCVGLLFAASLFFLPEFASRIDDFVVWGFMAVAACTWIANLPIFYSRHRGTS